MVLTLDSCDHGGLLAPLCCPTSGGEGSTGEGALELSPLLPV